MKQRTNEIITSEVKEFYERNPYPGLEQKLSFRSARWLSPYFKKSGRILYPGCGTGHDMVAMGVLRPDLEVYGLDLSQSSLDLAKKLAEKYKVDIQLKQGNYMQALPWDISFDYIVLSGTLHHTADPVSALKNVLSYLEDDGLVYVHLYGKKYHKRRFEIIEMLDLLCEGNESIEERFSFFQAFQEKEKKKSLGSMIADFSLRKGLDWLRKNYHRFLSIFSKETSAVPFTVRFKKPNQLWLDQFMHPHEKTYGIPETRDLMEAADLDVIAMFSLGRVALDDLPLSWRARVQELGSWDQYRLMELYRPKGGSISLVARKKR